MAAAICKSCGRALAQGPGAPLPATPGFDWDYDENALRLGAGRVIWLTPQSADLFEILRRRIGHVVHMEAIVGGLFGRSVSDRAWPEKALHVAVFHLRHRLEGTELRVVNHHGVGYELVVGGP